MNGRLAGLNITVANTDQQLYAANGSNTTACTVSITNRNNTTVKVRLALTTSTNVTDDSYLLFDADIHPNETLERSGIVVGPTQYLYARSNVTAVSFVVYGYEEA